MVHSHNTAKLEQFLVIIYTQTIFKHLLLQNCDTTIFTLKELGSIVLVLLLTLRFVKLRIRHESVPIQTPKV